MSEVAVNVLNVPIVASITNHICHPFHRRRQTARLSDCAPHIHTGLAGRRAGAHRPTADALPGRAGVRRRRRHVRRRWRDQRYLPLGGARLGHGLLLCCESSAGTRTQARGANAPLSHSLSPRALIGEPPRPLAFPGIGWDRGSLCVVARPATRFGYVQHSLIRHGVAVPTRNELAARAWNRQDTRGGRRRRCAVELVAKSIRAHLDIAEPERPRCCSSSPHVWKLRGN